MYCSRYSHCKLVRELKLQSSRRKDILQLHTFRNEASALKKKAMAPKMLEIMLPAFMKVQ